MPKPIDAVTRRAVLVGGAALLAVSPMRLARGRQVGAGYVERLMVRSLASDLKRGTMSTVVNGEIVASAKAERMVAATRAQGWL
jgi:hypothetical protein